MQVARIEVDGRTVSAFVEDDFYIACTPLDGQENLTPLQIARLSREVRERQFREAVQHGQKFSKESVRLRAPVERPGRILGIGLNYLDHARETGREPPQTQMWFNKQSSALHDPVGEVDLPAVSGALDYEVELVAVIGAFGRHVPKERANELIAGYMVGCDYSVRDWQKASPTMIMGKGFDTHAPVGPWMTMADSVADLDGLHLRCFVNGELRQDGCAKDMIFDLSEQISHLSKAFTLEPGDLIFTGTPAGVGVAHNPPKFLKDGDLVRVEIDQLGGFEHKIVQEEAVVRIEQVR